ncbi:VENN motif pre-toxin domain-containing protein, partial [Gilliamella sp. App4-10]|uniref:VENN motif pre-toxin domain-containing protein n=1 Tax=Gilliamella sp. App4-10 TaxID=3120231 RepID=UPI001146BF3E
TSKAKEALNKEQEKAKNNKTVLTDEQQQKIYEDAYKEAMNQGMSAMGSETRQGIDMAVNLINGIISGDMTGAVAGALAPKIASAIKKQTEHYNPETGKWETDHIANTVSHAILGGVVAQLQGNSALVGGLGAAASERSAEVIAGILYPDKDIKDLSQEERQQISALSQLATGLATAAAGGDIQDINTGVAAGKNAVENNNLARATWYLIRPSEIGAAVSINAVDVLMAEGLTAAESKAFLESLNLEQRRLIELALVDPMGDGFLEDAVLKTYERYYNDYLKEKDSNKDNNTLTGVGSSSAGGASGLPPNDDDDKSPKESSRNSDKKGVGGNGASSELPNLDGKSPEQARKILEKYGFEEKSISPAGYQRFVAKDGSEITINWNSGRTVRTPAPKYGPNGARINKGQRLDANGREIPRDVLHNQHPTETLNIK